MENSLKRLEEVAESRKKLNERMDEMEKKIDEFNPISFKKDFE